MSFPQSGHRMSSLSVRKPRPTSEREHFLQLKQSLCHCRSSKEMYFVPPSPVNREERTPGWKKKGAMAGENQASRTNEGILDWAISKLDCVVWRVWVSNGWQSTGQSDTQRSSYYEQEQIHKPAPKWHDQSSNYGGTIVSVCLFHQNETLGDLELVSLISSLGASSLVLNYFVISWMKCWRDVRGKYAFSLAWPGKASLKKWHVDVGGGHSWRVNIMR